MEKRNSSDDRQLHTIPPVFDKNSKILILGSFPSVKSRQQQFFYGHPQNRFWKVLAGVFAEDTPQTVKEKKTFLLSHGIAVWDVIGSCTITGSSDASIRDVVPNDLSVILDQTSVTTIYINGTKAYELFCRYTKPLLQSRYQSPIANAVLLPSTSPANAAWRVNDLMNAWLRIRMGLLRRPLNKAYYPFGAFAEDQFGKKLYRLSLDGGFTCPNRDGTKGTGGCIFCDGSGSGRFAGTLSARDTIRKELPGIREQLICQKELIAPKLPKTKQVGYIAYFQAFTGTYDTPERLRSLYLEAIADPEVKILDIATRPDCLSDEVMDVLCEINEKKPVWIELGLQTIHKKTAELIRRGYMTKEYDDALTRLKKAGIPQVITHLILGLPGEDAAMMKKSLIHAVEKGSAGIKLSMLHVLAGTELEKIYQAGKMDVFTLEEYKALLGELLAVLPPDVAVHRLTGDGDKRTLIAPLWSADKKHVLNELKNMYSTEERSVIR